MSDHLLQHSSNLQQPGSLVTSNVEDFEETLMYVRFDDFDDINFFIESEKMTFENLESQKPTVVVDGFRFEGTHRINLGTVLFFGADSSLDNEGLESGQIRPSTKMKYIGKSESLLSLSLREIPLPNPSEAGNQQINVENIGNNEQMKHNEKD